VNRVSRLCPFVNGKTIEFVPHTLLNKVCQSEITLYGIKYKRIRQYIVGISKKQLGQAYTFEDFKTQIYCT
jgi:hypothetical protein